MEIVHFANIVPSSLRGNSRGLAGEPRITLRAPILPKDTVGEVAEKEENEGRNKDRYPVEAESPVPVLSNHLNAKTLSFSVAGELQPHKAPEGEVPADLSAQAEFPFSGESPPPQPETLISNQGFVWMVNSHYMPRPAIDSGILLSYA